MSKDSAGPPHDVGLLFSGANAVSTLRFRPGWSFECDSLAGVSKSGYFTHNMTFFHRDVRGKRFNTHGELHCMEMIISKDHVTEKPWLGWDLWRHGRP